MTTTYKIKEKYSDLESKLKLLIKERIEPIKLIIGPDGFAYLPGVTSESFDKRYFRR